MSFPASVKLFGGRKSLLGLRITWSLPPGRSGHRPKATDHSRCIQWEVFHSGAIGCGVAQLAERLAPRRGRRAVSDGPRPSRAWTLLRALRAEGRPWGGAPRPWATGELRHPPRAGPCGTDHLSAPLSQPLAHTPSPMAQPWRPVDGSEQCHLGPQETYATTEWSSRLAGGSAKPSFGQHPQAAPDSSREAPMLRPSPHPVLRPSLPSARPAGRATVPGPQHCSALAGARRGPSGALGLTPPFFLPDFQETNLPCPRSQTTLWTFSLLFKSASGEGGKKSRGDRINWKKKIRRVSTATKKVTY